MVNMSLNILQNVRVIKDVLAETKVYFEEYIKDTSIPLEERWEVWVEAPMALKGTDTCTSTFKGLPEGYIGCDLAFSVERYQTRSTLELVECVECKDNNLAIDIVALKEDILARNLGSFTYDW